MKKKETITEMIRRIIKEEKESNPPGESRFKRLCQKYGVKYQKVQPRLSRGQTRNWSADYYIYTDDESKKIKYSPSMLSEKTLMKYFVQLGVNI